MEQALNMDEILNKLSEKFEKHADFIIPYVVNWWWVGGIILLILVIIVVVLILLQQVFMVGV